MTTISDGTTTKTPLLVTGWNSTRTTGNVLHNVIDRADDEVTYRVAGLREGTLELLFPTLEAALDCEVFVAAAQKLTLTDPDHAVLNMAFVAAGGIGVELDDETRIQAVVTIVFKQVKP